MLMIAAAVNTVLVVAETTTERFQFVMNAKKKKTTIIPTEKN